MLQASVVSRRMPVFASVGATRHKPLVHSVVSLDVTVPGLTSSGPRRQLQRTLGDAVRVYVVATDRRHACITLRVEIAGQSAGEVIGALTGCFTQATLGRTVTTLVHRAA
jgi:hypothetical protein